jgi:hypothetical protein
MPGPPHDGTAQGHGDGGAGLGAHDGDVRVIGDARHGDGRDRVGGGPAQDAVVVVEAGARDEERRVVRELLDDGVELVGDDGEVGGDPVGVRAEERAGAIVVSRRGRAIDLALGQIDLKDAALPDHVVEDDAEGGRRARRRVVDLHRHVRGGVAGVGQDHRELGAGRVVLAEQGVRVLVVEIDGPVLTAEVAAVHRRGGARIGAARGGATGVADLAQRTAALGIEAAPIGTAAQDRLAIAGGKTRLARCAADAHRADLGRDTGGHVHHHAGRALNDPGAHAAQAIDRADPCFAPVSRRWVADGAASNGESHREERRCEERSEGEAHGASVAAASSSSEATGERAHALTADGHRASGAGARAHGPARRDWPARREAPARGARPGRCWCRPTKARGGSRAPRDATDGAPRGCAPPRHPRSLRRGPRAPGPSNPS